MDWISAALALLKIVAIISALGAVGLVARECYQGIQEAERNKIEREALKERVKNLQERKATDEHLRSLDLDTLRRCAAGELHLCADKRP